jgi:microcystin-dependent protein
MSDPYLGEIRMVAFNFAPADWALCQGQTIPVAQNQALFTLLNTTYGGNGASNFQLPNLAGRSPVGTGTGTNLTPVNLGDSLGSEKVTLTNDQLPTHTHVITASGGGTVTGSVAIPATTSTAGALETPGTNTVLGPPAAAGRAGTLYNTSTANTTLAPFNITLQAAAPVVTAANAGLGLPTAIRNPYLGVNFVIALQGIFPSRG